MALNTLSFLVFNIFIASLAHAGSMVSGGVEFTTPWYSMNNAPVEYCIRVSENFSISKNQLQNDVRNAFDNWLKKSEKEDLRTFDGKKAARLFVEAPCSDNTLLTFLFGVNTKPVQDVYQQIYPDYLSINLIFEYNIAKEQPIGLIWLPEDKPNSDFFMIRNQPFFKWSNEIELFEQVLTEEVGYVFGKRPIK